MYKQLKDLALAQKQNTSKTENFWAKAFHTPQFVNPLFGKCKQGSPDQ